MQNEGNSCTHTPTALHIYGVYEIAGIPRDYPMNEVQLCNQCGASLWAQIKDSVADQYMHYEIKPLPNDQIEGRAEGESHSNAELGSAKGKK